MESDNNPLARDREKNRRLGYAVIDLLLDYHENKRDWRVSRVPGREEMQSLLGGDPPMDPTPELEVLQQFVTDVVPNISHVDHPAFFAFVPGPGNFAGTMADTLSSGFNIFAGTWLGGAAAAQIEITVLRWFVEICGFPGTAGGLLVSGGSAASLTALTVARDQKLGTDISTGIAYCSTQTHSSVDRALRILGIPASRLRRLPVDQDFRLDLSALRTAVERDVENGLRPFCVIGNAGTTNTGAVDPLNEIAEICGNYGLWFHLDGAYGASAAICGRGRRLLDGMNRADSIVLDPHKWLFQPFETGCVLLRDARLLRDTFSIHPEYMQDTNRALEEVNFCDYGIQLSRGFRALKVWMTFKIYGRKAIEAAVEHGFEMAEFARTCVESKRNWEICSVPTMGVVSFRFAPSNLSVDEQDRRTKAASRLLLAGGRAMVSTTELRGRTVIRMCPINPETTHADIVMTVDALDEIVRSLDDPDRKT